MKQRMKLLIPKARNIRIIDRCKSLRYKILICFLSFVLGESNACSLEDEVFDAMPFTNVAGLDFFYFSIF